MKGYYRQDSARRVGCRRKVLRLAIFCFVLLAIWTILLNWMFDTEETRNNVQTADYYIKHYRAFFGRWPRSEKEVSAKIWLGGEHLNHPMEPNIVFRLTSGHGKEAKYKVRCVENLTGIYYWRELDEGLTEEYAKELKGSGMFGPP